MSIANLQCFQTEMIRAERFIEANNANLDVVYPYINYSQNKAFKNNEVKKSTEINSVNFS